MRTEVEMDKTLPAARPSSGRPAGATPLQSFAAELTETLGRERAISACRENNWHGILKEIEKLPHAP